MNWNNKGFTVAKGKADLDIRERIETHEITIFGDFDADGLCSSAIAKLAMPDADIYIPNRSDGYGLSFDAINGIGEGRLIFTVDCGISWCDELDMMESSSDYRFVVTDHHIPPKFDFPHNFPIINPKYTGLGYEGLSGSGVIFLLIRDMCLLEEDGETYNHALQLAAIGTMCDMMPMLQNNRTIVREGVQLMRDAPCPAVAAMAEVCGIDERYITEETLSWYFGPILNSAGRTGDLDQAVEMLYTLRPSRARKLAKELKSKKDKNKRRITKMVKSLEQGEMIETDNVIIVDASAYPDMPTGPVGSNLLRSTSLPTMVFIEREDIYVGSFRCPDKFNASGLIALMKEASIIIDGGGHRGAAGFQFEKNMLPHVTNYIIDYAEREEVQTSGGDKSDADISISLANAMYLFGEFEELQPYGMKFEKPTFMSHISSFDNYRLMGKGKEHCAFQVFGIDCVAFGLADRIPEDAGELIVVYELSRNSSVYGATGEKQIIIRDVEVL